MEVLDAFPSPPGSSRSLVSESELVRQTGVAKYFHHPVKIFSLLVAVRENDIFHAERGKPPPEFRYHSSCIVFPLLKPIGDGQVRKRERVIRLLLEIRSRRRLCRGKIAGPEIGQREVVGHPGGVVRTEPHRGLEGSDRSFALPTENT